MTLFRSLKFCWRVGNFHVTSLLNPVNDNHAVSSRGNLGIALQAHVHIFQTFVMCLGEGEIDDTQLPAYEFLNQCEGDLEYAYKDDIESEIHNVKFPLNIVD